MSRLSDKLGIKYEEDDPGGYVKKTHAKNKEPASATSNALYYMSAALVIPACIYVTFPGTCRDLISSIYNHWKAEDRKPAIEKIEPRPESFLAAEQQKQSQVNQR